MARGAFFLYRTLAVFFHGPYPDPAGRTPNPNPKKASAAFLCALDSTLVFCSTQI
jgi:hypothetical protein